MIRVLLPLVLALVAFFGPWAGDTHGYDYADTTVDCFIDELKISIIGACAPTGTTGERLVTYAIVGSGAAAILSVFGLLPLIGRLTSAVVALVGLTAVAAAALMLVSLFGADATGAEPGWGLFASLALGIGNAAAGVLGVRGEQD